MCFHLVIFYIFLLSLHIFLLLFASSVLGIALNGSFQIHIPTTLLFSSNTLILFCPYLSPAFSHGRKKLLSLVDCVCSPACWLCDLTPWASMERWCPVADKAVLRLGCVVGVGRCVPIAPGAEPHPGAKGHELLLSEQANAPLQSRWVPVVI